LENFHFQTLPLTPLTLLTRPDQLFERRIF
jgi:hypothetical protein